MKVMMVVMAAGGLGEIADVGKLSALRGAGEILGKLVELVRRGGVAL